MIYEIYDSSNPILEAIKTLAPEVAKEQISKAGNSVKKAMQERAKKRSHGWFQKLSKNNKKYLIKSKYKRKTLGDRDNLYGTATGADNVVDIISSYFMEQHGTLVVGGVHKAFTPILRKNGKVVGVGKRVKGRGRELQAIIHKLDTGERNKDHGWYVNGKISKKSMREKGKGLGIYGKKFKGRYFMRRGIIDAKGDIKTRLTSEYSSIMKTQLSRITIKRKYVS